MDGSLTAVCLPAPEAAPVIRSLWDDGRAVLPLDPRAPAPERTGALEATRPAALVDAEGHRPLPGGRPVPAGVAAVVTTSGTAGDPKGVELTWAGLRASAEAVARSHGAGPDDRWLCCLPLHGVAGLGVLARGWASGTSVDVVDHYGLDVASRTEATLVSLVPTQVVRALAADPRAIGRFRCILVGGAPVDDDLRRRAAGAGARLTATYGLTETWGGVVHDGRPLAGTEVLLGERDEILVRGPTVMHGYRLRPDLTRAALTPDGWLHTGDVGRWSPEGDLQVVDRLRDLVITGGVTVSPSEVEAVLHDHPGVADACVAGAPDPEWGERVVAYIVPAVPADPPTLAELRAFAGRRLSGPKLPRSLVVVAAIPRSEGGKPLRRLLAG